MTARKAIDILRSEGLVHSVHGRGVFVNSLAGPSATSGDVAEVVADLKRRVAQLDRRVRALEAERK